MAAPDISVYRELSLEGMNLDSVDWGGSILRAEYGDGYGDEALVGSANGNHRWALSPVALVDDASYGDQIEGVPSFAYYWDFFKEHTTGARSVFLVEFRGRKYFASFVETRMSAEIFTSDLFGAGVEIRQRRVRGFYEGTDGSVFDPSFLADGLLWAWYKGDETQDLGAGILRAVDQTGQSNWVTEVDGGGITAVPDVVNGLGVLRFDGSDFLNTTADPVIYEAFFLMKCDGATFPTFAGILTASVTTAALVGNNGDNKLVDFSFGGTYSYWLNGVLKTEATQLAPMNTFGVIHARWTNGITLTNLQIGKDRDFVARFLDGDIAEVLLVATAPLSTEYATDMDGYLMKRGAIT